MTSASVVVLRQAAGDLVGVLSLYNTTEVFNPFTLEGDRFETLGHRLLAQAVGTSSAGPQLVRNLAPGTYYVAVSGAGNPFFHPFVADSGYAGAEGEYTLQMTAADLGLDPTDGPAVLAVDPEPGSVLGLRHRRVPLSSG